MSCKPLIKELQYVPKTHIEFTHFYSPSLKKQKRIVEVFADLISIREKILENSIYYCQDVPGAGGHEMLDH